MAPFIYFNIYSLLYYAVEDVPNLAEILQGYVDAHIQQRDIPDQLEKDHGVRIGYDFFCPSAQ